MGKRSADYAFSAIMDHGYVVFGRVPIILSLIFGSPNADLPKSNSLETDAVGDGYIASQSRWALSTLRVAALSVLLSGIFVAVFCPTLPVGAMEIEFPGTRVKRDILVLYDRRAETDVHLTRVHRYAEMPLNHLGFKLTYWDVNEPLPDPTELKIYRGVLTWFVEPLARPASIAAWLDEATQSGLRYGVLGEVVPSASAATLPVIDKLLARLGLKDGRNFVSLTYKARVDKLDRDFIGFERPVDKVLPDFPVMLEVGSAPAQKGTAKPVAGAVKANVHLSIKAPIEGVELNAVVVATSANGGYAAQNYTFAFEPNTNRVRWILNPFKFFSAVFGGERFPIPDTTTLAGQRIYFSHIDGDGWNNLSEIEAYRKAQLLSSQVITREAIEAFPDLPVSVALIAGDIDLRLGGNPKGASVARRVFALPQVEVASHTHTHPYDWQFFGHYDRSVELEKIERFRRPDAPLRRQFRAAVLRLANKAVPADRYNKYVAGTDDLPRTYLKQPFSLDLEVGEALRISQNLAPPGKKAKLYQWSGDTTPFPGAIAATRAAGVRNLNGGDSRLDAEYPSIAYVPAISRVTGGQRQIYAVNSNENTYTNDWTGPYYGFFMLEHTLKNTDSPRRLKAFNLYYHMYSGEKPAALASVKHFLNMARNSPVIPIAASHYAAIADDYFNAVIERIGPSSWAIKNRGAMQTMRFDDADTLGLNYSRSSGVLGATRHEGSLYVSLDPAMTRAVISLRSRGQAAGDGFAQQSARLVASRWQISKFVKQGCGFSVVAQGYGPGKMIWQTKPKRGFVITVRRGEKTLSEETRWADDKGLLKLSANMSALKPLRLGFSCHE